MKVLIFTLTLRANAIKVAFCLLLLLSILFTGNVYLINLEFASMNWSVKVYFLGFDFSPFV